MKLVCKSCKYEQIVQDKSLTQCPRCGSNDIKIFLFGSTTSTKMREMKSKKGINEEKKMFLILLAGLVIGVFLIYLSITGYANISTIKCDWWGFECREKTAGELFNDYLEASGPLIWGIIIIIPSFLLLLKWIIIKIKERKFEVLPGQELIESMPKEQSEELEGIQEEVEDTTLEEQPEELEVLQEEVPSALEKMPEELQVISIREIGLEAEIKPELVIPPKIEKLEVAQNELEKSLNIDQLRSKFKNEIEKIKEIVEREHFYISLSGIDEVILSLENLNLKDRREIMDIYLNKLIGSSINLRENPYTRLINKNDVKKANLEINRTEIDLMRRILPIKGIKVSEPEKQPEKVEALQQEAQIISAPIDHAEEVLLEEVPRVLKEIPKEMEVLPEEEIVVSTPEVQPKELEVLQEEEISKVKPEEEPEELIPLKPQIVKCPFCRKDINEGTPFCSQCGMIFKKK